MDRRRGALYSLRTEFEACAGVLQIDVSAPSTSVVVEFKEGATTQKSKKQKNAEVESSVVDVEEQESDFEGWVAADGGSDDEEDATEEEEGESDFEGWVAADVVNENDGQEKVPSTKKSPSTKSAKASDKKLSRSSTKGKQSKTDAVKTPANKIDSSGMKVSASKVKASPAPAATPKRRVRIVLERNLTQEFDLNIPMTPKEPVIALLFSKHLCLQNNTRLPCRHLKY